MLSCFQLMTCGFVRKNPHSISSCDLLTLGFNDSVNLTWKCCNRDSCLSVQGIYCMWVMTAARGATRFSAWAASGLQTCDLKNENKCFRLSETGSRGRPVCLHLHSGPSHLDQPAVLGSHVLQWSPESDQSPLSEHSRAENGPRCQDKGKAEMRRTIESTTWSSDLFRSSWGKRVESWKHLPLIQKASSVLENEKGCHFFFFDLITFP